jgi:hypothetical protein
MSTFYLLPIINYQNKGFLPNTSKIQQLLSHIPLPSIYDKNGLLGGGYGLTYGVLLFCFYGNGILYLYLPFDTMTIAAYQELSRAILRESTYYLNCFTSNWSIDYLIKSTWIPRGKTLCLSTYEPEINTLLKNLAKDLDSKNLDKQTIANLSNQLDETPTLEWIQNNLKGVTIFVTNDTNLPTPYPSSTLITSLDPKTILNTKSTNLESSDLRGKYLHSLVIEKPYGEKLHGADNRYIGMYYWGNINCQIFCIVSDMYIGYDYILFATNFCELTPQLVFNVLKTKVPMKTGENYTLNLCFSTVTGENLWVTPKIDKPYTTHKQLVVEAFKKANEYFGLSNSLDSDDSTRISIPIYKLTGISITYHSNMKRFLSLFDKDKPIIMKLPKS